jgi:hypothetical protein
VYIFVVASGLLFIENPKRIEPLAVALAIQIPSFSSPIVLYKLTAGLELYVGVLAGGPLLSYDIGIGSTFQIIFFQDVPFGFGINLVATALLILVLAARKAADPYRARSFGVGH